jgi:hypothetical protein
MAKANTDVMAMEHNNAREHGNRHGGRGGGDVGG